MTPELRALQDLQLNALRLQLQAAEDLVRFHRKQYQDALREQQDA